MTTFNEPSKYHKFAEPSKYCDTCRPHIIKFWHKYLRIRTAVRVLNIVLEKRKYKEDRRRYFNLLKVCEQLSFEAGKLVGRTDDFCWLRLTHQDYNDFMTWRREKNGTK